MKIFIMRGDRFEITAPGHSVAASQEKHLRNSNVIGNTRPCYPNRRQKGASPLPPIVHLNSGFLSVNEEVQVDQSGCIVQHYERGCIYGQDV